MQSKEVEQILAQALSDHCWALITSLQGQGTPLGKVQIYKQVTLTPIPFGPF